MLSENDLKLLYKIISNEKQTFSEISEMFNKNFNDDSKRKAINTLLILLEDNLLNIHQRIISYYILYDMSNKEKIDINPYLSFILEKLRKSNDKIEQNFLIDFLCNKIYLNLTIENYIKNKTEQRINTIQIQMQWNKYYKDILRQKNIKIDKDDIARPVIYDRKNCEIKNIYSNLNNNLLENKMNKNEMNLNFNYYKANSLSYYPVNNDFLSSEPVWLRPSLNHNYIWEK
jgi:hypothetical protein